MLRYDIANALHLNVESKTQMGIVENICKDLEKEGFADAKWDEENFIQKSYKSQGLKRYRIEIKGLLNKKQVVEKNEERFESTCALSSKDNGLDKLTGNAISIKVESKAVLDLISTKNVLKQGEQKVNTLYTQFKRLSYQIELIKGHDEGPL